MDVYPIFLTGLTNRRCVVIGGAHEAERKVAGLLACAAAVTVISPDLTAKLHTWAHEGTVTWVSRDYVYGDLQHAFLVIAADVDEQTAEAVYREANEVSALINVTDDPAHSNFVAGSVVRQGPLTISISTSGSAPALAVRLRQQLEREFGPEYAVLLSLLRELRETVAKRYPNAQERRNLWYQLLDSDLLELLRAGHYDLAQQLIALLIGDDAISAAQLATRREVDGT